MTYEGVLPGFDAMVNDPWEQGEAVEWGKWVAAHGLDVPSSPLDLYAPDSGYPGASEHALAWAPTRFPAELSETAFMTERQWNGCAEMAVSLSSCTSLTSALIRPAATRSGTTTCTRRQKSGLLRALPIQRKRRPSTRSTPHLWHLP
jgi:hypothetical protein